MSDDTKTSVFKINGKFALARRTFKAPFSYQDSLADEARMVHVLKGHSRLICAGKVIELSPGDTLLMKADNFINHWHNHGENTEVDIIGFCLSRSLIQHLYPPTKPVPFTIESSDVTAAVSINSTIKFSRLPLLTNFMSGIKSYIEEPEFFTEPLVELKIRELFELLPAVSSGNELRVLLSQLFHCQQPKLQEVVRTHLFTPLNIDELAFLCHMSVSTLNRKFKQLYGTSVNKYIVAKRLEKAQMLMRQTDRSLSDIAIDCGFDDAGYFSRVFKQKMTLSPSQWRKQLAEI